MIKLWRLGLQYLRFGGVGLCSTVTHVGVFTGLIELLAVTPVISNLLAFCVAVVVSFVGHFHWTFPDEAGQGRSARAAFLRFGATAIFGLALNTLIVYLVDQIWQLSYLYAILAMVVADPTDRLRDRQVLGLPGDPGAQRGVRRALAWLGQAA